MKISMPSEVSNILKTFYLNGYQAFLVGGCVRDSLLSKAASDFDITTNALPEKIISLFPHTVPTGIKHGTITIVSNGKTFEATTFRIDGDYFDGRHPEKVCFASSIEEDLSRRDFTINAMAYSDELGLIDPFGGKKDLKYGLIRTVGEPDLRFNEDALRMLRAVRFASVLSFSIHDASFSSIKMNSELICRISAERIRAELCKILLSLLPSRGIRLLKDSRLLSFIMPELQNCDLFEHIMSVVDHTPADLSLRLAALFNHIGGKNESVNIAEEIMKRLKFDNLTIDKVVKLITCDLPCYQKFSEIDVKKLIVKVGSENVAEFFQLQLADYADSRSFDSSNILKIRDTARKILSENQPISLKDLKISGEDLKELGYKQGKEIGQELKRLLSLVLEDPSLNTKEKLAALVNSR